MKESVNAVYERGNLWYPLLNLVATFIDGLASGPKGGTRPAYIQYLETNFPQLCLALGAATFYENYRNAAVHEFSLKPGYAIGRDSGMKGQYVDTQLLTDIGTQQIVLNIDRLVADFVGHVDLLLSYAARHKAP